MGTDPATNEEAPSLQAVLNALDDPDCRAILRETAEPMTAKELTDTCDIPTSTMYRKLDLLSTASLVRELITVHPDRGRITRYQRDFNALTISMKDDDQLDVGISRPTRPVNERLAEMWSELGEEL